MGFGLHTRLNEETVRHHFESESLNYRSRPDNVDHRHIDHLLQKGTREILSSFESLNSKRILHSILSPRLRRGSRQLRPRRKHFSAEPQISHINHAELQKKPEAVKENDKPATTNDSPELQLVIAQEEAGEKSLLPPLPSGTTEVAGEDSHAETLASSEPKLTPKQYIRKEVPPFLTIETEEAIESAQKEEQKKADASNNNVFNLASLIEMFQPNASPVSEDGTRTMRAFSTKNPIEAPSSEGKRSAPANHGNLTMRRRESESVKMTPFVSLASRKQEKERRQKERKLKRE